MNITYNQHSKERENVIAPTVEEMNYALNEIGASLEYSLLGDRLEKVNDIFQRLIWHYENLEHFHTVVGGWEGLDKIRLNMFNEGAYNGMAADTIEEAGVGTLNNVYNNTTDKSIRECEGMPFINPKDETE